MQLTNRLQKIADSIEINERVADIGTDHGYLPIYLYSEGISREIIISDVNKGPMEIALKNIEIHIGKGHNIKSRIGNGLEVIGDNEADTVVIAGMGGLLIQEILSKDIEKSRAIKKLILQPRNAQDKLRKWLTENGFKIIDEHLAEEGRYICEIIVATPGKSQSENNEIYYEIPKILIHKNDPLLKEFIKRKIKTEKAILMNTMNEDSLKAKKQSEYSEKRIHILEEVLKDVSKNK
ncbi:MAG: SAM-dependent methyltransferase [Clostridiales bacterium]|nr:SAM-dependent methyltransferase [Clostridiales bacterium]